MRPVNLRDWEARAIIDRRKTTIRRPIRPLAQDGAVVIADFSGHGWWPYRSEDGESASRRGCEFQEEPLSCPFGPAGSYLYGRECWQIATGLQEGDLGAAIRYRASGWEKSNWSSIRPVTMPADRPMPLGLTFDRCRSAMHMPCWASRIRLRVLERWVEQAQDIVGEDGRLEEEGFRFPDHVDAIARYAAAWDKEFRALYRWDQNPWVWVCRFELEEP